MRLWKNTDRKVEVTWSAPTGIRRTTQEDLRSVVGWLMSRWLVAGAGQFCPPIWGYFLCSAVLSTGFIDLDKRSIKAAVFHI